MTQETKIHRLGSTLSIEVGATKYSVAVYNGLHPSPTGAAAVEAALRERDALREALKGLLNTAAVVDSCNKVKYGNDCHGFAADLLASCRTALNRQ